MKRSGFKRKLTTSLKRTKLRVAGKSSTAERCEEIQALVREIVMLRDQGCVLRKIRNCNDPVKQADHLITRSNSATFADTRLIVCLCRSCHGWKHWNEHEYNDLVRQLISPQRVKLWDACETERKAHKTYKVDWGMAIIYLKKELEEYRLLKK